MFGAVASQVEGLKLRKGTNLPVAIRRHFGLGTWVEAGDVPKCRLFGELLEGGKDGKGVAYGGDRLSKLLNLKVINVTKQGPGAD
jgi:hypothetical protein